MAPIILQIAKYVAIIGSIYGARKLFEKRIEKMSPEEIEKLLRILRKCGLS
ncbi:MAG: hypothetical protein OXD33_09015 [Rhodobacteraceae bacterium]|nr:hypothetical protein [Paracoccaceae bacterium]